MNGLSTHMFSQCSPQKPDRGVLLTVCRLVWHSRYPNVCVCTNTKRFFLMRPLKVGTWTLPPPLEITHHRSIATGRLVAHYTLLLFYRPLCRSWQSITYFFLATGQLMWKWDDQSIVSLLHSLHQSRVSRACWMSFWEPQAAIPGICFRLVKTVIKTRGQRVILIYYKAFV